MAEMITHLSDISKKTLPVIFYCATDYYFSRFYLRNDMVLPIPAVHSVISTLLVIGMILGVSCISLRRLMVPKFNAYGLISAISLSFVFRYNLLDLNHNFGDPPYKRITAILLPLILAVNGCNGTSCAGVFLAILLSSSALNQTLGIQGAIFGGILSPFMYAGFYFLAKYHSENKDHNECLSVQTQTKSFLEISISVFTGVLICDAAAMMSLGPTYDVKSSFGAIGIVLYAFSILSKFMLIYFSNNWCDYALMINWITKTIMFSFTYTLGYKFDLAISNLLAILFWVLYVVGSFIVRSVQEKKLPKVKYSVLPHSD